MPEDLFLYNTASRQKEKLETLEPGKIRMYCCGPTVYNFAHIGNLRTYVFEDFLRRILEYLQYDVKHAVNITDVGHLTSDADTGDDKMEKGALREGKTVWEIAAWYTQEFQKDWKRLNLLEPTLWPKATDHIQEQIALVKSLEDKGFTYRIEDGIYFDTGKFPRYAAFAGLDTENLEAGIRVAMTEGKKSPTDFALWKFSPAGSRRAMEWDSPWGTGFPGWHAECSAMAMKHLGESLDIHCGGTDHIRVHHTNEIAQSECASGKPFSRFWIHGGWLVESQGKMSKSKNEFIRLQTLLERGFDPMDFKYLCATSHYRNYLHFSWDTLKSAAAAMKSLRSKVQPLITKAVKVDSDKGRDWLQKFLSAVCDDLNIPQAMGIMNLMIKDIDLMESEKGALLLEFDKILGLRLEPAQSANQGKETEPDAELLNLLEERNQARKSRDFKRADEIRDILKDRGYVLKDTPETTTLVKIS